MTDQLYAVAVEQTSVGTFWVSAPTEKQAREDAYELAEDTDWDVIDVDITVKEAIFEPRPRELVWTGGEEGSWVHWEDLKPKPLHEESLF
jgi:hypothetical protein